MSPRQGRPHLMIRVVTRLPNLKKKKKKYIYNNNNNLKFYIYLTLKKKIGNTLNFFYTNKIKFWSII